MIGGLVTGVGKQGGEGEGEGRSGGRDLEKWRVICSGRKG